MHVSAVQTSFYIALILDVGTNCVESYRCVDSDLGTFWLIDTPGFDDTYRTDTEVLGDIVNWLNFAYLGKIQLTGIIYVHAIREARMGAKAINSVRSFTELCGPDAMRRVVMVSTFWDNVDPIEGVRRERQLETDPDFWAQMCQHGSTTFRHYNKLSTARDVIRHLLRMSTEMDRGTYLNIQREMVDGGKKLEETGAGLLMLDALERQRIEFDQRLASLEDELHQAIRQQKESQRQKIEEMRLDAQRKRRLVEDDRVRLDADYESLSRMLADRDAMEATEERQKEEEMEEHVRRLAAELRELRDRKAELEQHDQKQRELDIRRRDLEILQWRRRRRQRQLDVGCVVS
jgi:hypothetical protein